MEQIKRKYTDRDWRRGFEAGHRGQNFVVPTGSDPHLFREGFIIGRKPYSQARHRKTPQPAIKGGNMRNQINRRVALCTNNRTFDVRTSEVIVSLAA